jgi:hypothetical protein
MAQMILSLISVGVIIYALVDCGRSRPDEVVRLSRAGWAIVILALPLVGALAYLVVGRAPSPETGGLTGPRITAPDDDPDFLRALEFKRRQTLVEERRRREADEKRRKAERKEQRVERRSEKVDKGERTPEPATGEPAADPALNPGAPATGAPQPGEPEPEDRPGPPSAQDGR